VDQDRSLTDLPLQGFEGGLLLLGPLPCPILLEQIMQRACDIREAQDPSSVKVHKADELSYASDRGRVFPCGNRGGLFLIHFKSALANIHTQELDFGLVEFALLQIAE